MGVFDDKKFESLDWISQATEPIDSELNTLLSSLPDQVEITWDNYIKYVGDSWNTDLRISNVVSHLLKDTPKDQVNANLSWEEREHFFSNFQFEIEGNPEIDFEKREISGGKIYLVKVASTMEEDVLKKIMGADGIRQVQDMYVGMEANSRFNEIAELIGDRYGVARTKSPTKKRRYLSQRLKELFKTNEWNIKDTTLANKVGYWISDYIRNGDLSALSNFCRLKVMTHKGQPIYSMEEVK